MNPPSLEIDAEKLFVYINTVKRQFADKPDVVKKFQDIINARSVEHGTTTLDVIERIVVLFRGYPHLVQDLNTILPRPFHVALSDDPDVVTITTPEGVLTKRTDEAPCSKDPEHVAKFHKKIKESVVIKLSSTSPASAVALTNTVAYVDAVRNGFADRPDIPEEFKRIMSIARQIDPITLIERVIVLFHDYPRFVEGFNTLLQQRPGLTSFRVAITDDPDVFTITTPSGVLTKRTTLRRGRRMIH